MRVAIALPHLTEQNAKRVTLKSTLTLGVAMTNRGWFVGGVFSTIYVGSMVSMFHTLWTTPLYSKLDYSNLQLAGLVVGILGIAFTFYLWDTSPK